MPGAEHLRNSHDLQKLLVSQKQRNGFIAAICAAPAVVLSDLNIIPDKRATCYPAPKFTAKLAKHVDEDVVVDSNVITSKGPGTSMEFSLKLVEVLFGHERALQIRKEMLA